MERVECLGIVLHGSATRIVSKIGALTPSIEASSLSLSLLLLFFSRFA
jgi:hypothetical protein